MNIRELIALSCSRTPLVIYILIWLTVSWVILPTIPSAALERWQVPPSVHLFPNHPPVEVVVELCSNNSWQLKFSQMSHVYNYLFVRTVSSAYHKIPPSLPAEKPILVIQNKDGTTWDQRKRQKCIRVKPTFDFWLATFKLYALGYHVTFWLQFHIYEMRVMIFSSQAVWGII